MFIAAALHGYWPSASGQLAITEATWGLLSVGYWATRCLITDLPGKL